MTENRRIRKVVKSRSDDRRAGVHLHRRHCFGDPQLHDPFLLLDEFTARDNPSSTSKASRAIRTDGDGDHHVHVARADVEHEGQPRKRAYRSSMGDVQ